MTAVDAIVADDGSTTTWFDLCNVVCVFTDNYFLAPCHVHLAETEAK